MAKKKRGTSYGARYGSSIRNKLRKIEELQSKKYQCRTCLKTTVKRQCAGIWYCSKCNKSFTGGAYEFKTKASTFAEATIIRLRELAKEH